LLRNVTTQYLGLGHILWVDLSNGKQISDLEHETLGASIGQVR